MDDVYMGILVQLILSTFEEVWKFPADLKKKSLVFKFKKKNQTNKKTQQSLKWQYYSPKNKSVSVH